MVDQIIEFQNVWNDVRDVLEKRLAPQTFENTFVNVKNAHLLNQASKNCSMHIFEKSGHCLALSNHTSEYAEVLKDFLEKVEA